MQLSVYIPIYTDHLSEIRFLLTTMQQEYKAPFILHYNAALCYRYSTDRLSTATQHNAVHLKTKWMQYCNGVLGASCRGGNSSTATQMQVISRVWMNLYYLVGTQYHIFFNFLTSRYVHDSKWLSKILSVIEWIRIRSYRSREITGQ